MNCQMQFFKESFKNDMEKATETFINTYIETFLLSVAEIILPAENMQIISRPMGNKYCQSFSVAVNISDGLLRGITFPLMLSLS